MPEATVLYSVTAVVVAGLVVWVAAVLRTAKEPWARAAPPRSVALALEPIASSEEAPPAEDASGPASGDAPRSDADSTARATPVALAAEAKPAGEDAAADPSAEGADASAEGADPVAEGADASAEGPASDAAKRARDADA